MAEPLFFDLIAHYKHKESKHTNPFLATIDKIVTKDELTINTDLSY